MKNNVKWLLQDSFVPTQSLEGITKSLDGLDVEYYGFGVIPFTQDFTGLEYVNLNQPCVVRGSTKVLKNLYLNSDNSELDKYLRSGVFYDLERFDQFYYAAGLPMFNNVREIVKFRDIKTYRPKYDYFAKPTSDLKFFAGVKGFSGDSVYDTIRSEKIYLDEDTPSDMNIMICPLKSPPIEEYRAFIVCGDIVSICMYYKNGRLNKSDEVPSYIHKYVESCISDYQPHDVFTIDVCMSEDGLSIMEYNCWNVSGFYTNKLDMTVNSVNQYVKTL